jgi:hypothetical protein
VLDDAALIFRIDLTGERGTRALAGTAANPVCVSLLSDEDLARQMQRAFESEFRSAEAQSRRDLRLAKKLKRQDDEERQAAAESELFDILSDHRLSIQGWLATQQAIRPTHVVENPFSKPGMPLYNRFAEAWQRVSDQTVVIAFHGTAEANIDSICRTGLDPAKRGSISGQAYGAGEYFGATASVSIPYCKGGRKMLVVALLTDKSGLTANTGQIIVVNKPDHQLPLFVVTF